MTPRDTTTNSKRNIELAAANALRPTISENTLANFTTLLVGCLQTRDGLSARLGGSVRTAGTCLDLLRRGLLWKSMTPPQWLSTLLHLPRGAVARTSLV